MTSVDLCGTPAALSWVASEWRWPTPREDGMSGHTQVFGATMRRSEKWRLYQVRTANSTYELEVQSASPDDARRCAVLTCVAPESRAGQSFEDSAPRAGEQSLYAVSALDWIGKCLTVGTARTSEVQSVEFISASDAPSSVTRASRPRAQSGSNQTLVFQSSRAKAEEPPPWAPFPLGHVEMAEACASLLRALCHRHDLDAALSNHPAHRRRLELALAQCRVLLESLPERDG
jgi:hypothetical protein